MVFSLFKKKCPVCNMVVNKDTAVHRYGKYHCSEDHAEQYRANLVQKQPKNTNHHGSCH